MSLKKAIRNKLPFEWEVVLKSKKKLGLFVDLVYCSLPSYYRNKGGFKEGVKRVDYMFKHFSIPSQCVQLCWVNCNVKEIPVSQYRAILEEIDDLVDTYKFNNL